MYFFFFFFNDTATTEIYTLSLHDALPIWVRTSCFWFGSSPSVGSSRISTSGSWISACARRSEEHTSELQSRLHLVCRLLLEKKKKKKQSTPIQKLRTSSTERRASHVSVSV